MILVRIYGVHLLKFLMKKKNLIFKLIKSWVASKYTAQKTSAVKKDTIKKAI